MSAHSLPVGLDARQIRFMDTFLLYCLLEESPPCDEAEQDIQAANLESVVNRGRQPGLQLNNCSGEIPLTQWADSLLEKMRPVAGLLDSALDLAVSTPTAWLISLPRWPTRS